MIIKYEFSHEFCSVCIGEELGRHGWVATTHLLKDDKINPWQPMRQSVAYVDPQSRIVVVLATD